MSSGAWSESRPRGILTFTPDPLGVPCELTPPSPLLHPLVPVQHTTRIILFDTHVRLSTRCARLDELHLSCLPQCCFLIVCCLPLDIVWNLDLHECSVCPNLCYFEYLIHLFFLFSFLSISETLFSTLTTCQHAASVYPYTRQVDITAARWWIAGCVVVNAYVIPAATRGTEAQSVTMSAVFICICSVPRVD